MKIEKYIDFNILIYLLGEEMAKNFYSGFRGTVHRK